MLTLNVFMLAVAIVFVLVAAPWMTDPYNSLTLAAEPASVSFAVELQDSMVSGAQLDTPVVVQVRTSAGAPVAGVPVKLFLRPRKHTGLRLWSGERLAIVPGSALDNNLATLDSVELTGTLIQHSNEAGFARFDDIVLRGAPGDVTFSAGLVNQPAAAVADAQPLSTQLQNRIANMSTQFDADALLQAGAVLGRALPVMPVVSVVNVDGQPAVGTHCFIGYLPHSEPGAPQFRAPVFLTGNRSTTANATGFVSWPELAVAGAGQSALRLFVQCGGQFQPLLPGSLAVRSASVASIELVSAAQAAVPELEPLPEVPAVRVLDSAGQPVPGAVLVASIRSELSLTWTDTAPDCVLCTAPGAHRLMKSVQQAASQPSDSDGIARWPGMSFPSQGLAGQYSLRLSTLNTAGKPLHVALGPINVTSSVADVSLLPGTATVVSARLAASCVQPACANGEVSNSPVFLLTDSSGAPVEGKVLAPFVVDSYMAFAPASAAQPPVVVTGQGNPSDENGHFSFDIEPLTIKVSGNGTHTIGFREVASGFGGHEWPFLASLPPMTSASANLPTQMVTVTNLLPANDDRCAHVQAEESVLHASVGDTLADRLQVRVVNGWGSPVSGVPLLATMHKPAGAAWKAPVANTTSASGEASLGGGAVIYAPGSATVLSVAAAGSPSCSSGVLALHIASDVERVTVQSPSAASGDLGSRANPLPCATGQALNETLEVFAQTSTGSAVTSAVLGRVALFAWPGYLDVLPGYSTASGQTICDVQSGYGALGAQWCSSDQSGFFFSAGTNVDVGSPSGGVVSWSGVTVTRGQPGLYALLLEVNGVQADKPVWTWCPSELGSIRLAQSMDERTAADPIVIGSKVDGMRGAVVSLVDVNGDPLQGYSAWGAVDSRRSGLPAPFGYFLSQGVFSLQRAVGTVAGRGTLPAAPYNGFVFSDASNSAGNVTFGLLRVVSGDPCAIVAEPSPTCNGFGELFMLFTFPTPGQEDTGTAATGSLSARSARYFTVAQTLEPQHVFNPVQAVALRVLPSSVTASGATFAAQPMAQIEMRLPFALPSSTNDSALAVFSPQDIAVVPFLDPAGSNDAASGPLPTLEYSSLILTNATSEATRLVMGPSSFSTGSVAGAGGLAPFQGLRITAASTLLGSSASSSSLGKYPIRFTALGVASKAANVELVGTPDVLVIVQQPPEVVYIGQPWTGTVVVRAELRNGVAVPGVALRAEIASMVTDGAAANAELTALAREAGGITPVLRTQAGQDMTGSDGTLALQLELRQALPGTYTFQFSSNNGLTSQATNKVRVRSPVQAISANVDGMTLFLRAGNALDPVPRVTVTLQQSGGMDPASTSTLTSWSDDRDTVAEDSSVDFSDVSLEGMQVLPIVLPLFELQEGAARPSIIHGAAFTDANGTATLASMRIIGGVSGSYQLAFLAGGQVHQPANAATVQYNNPSDVGIQARTLEDLSTVVGVMIFFLMPLLCGNSIYCAKGCVCCMVPYMTILWILCIAYASSIATAGVGIKLQYADPFISLLVTSIVVLATLAWCSVCGVFGKALADAKHQDSSIIQAVVERFGGPSGPVGRALQAMGCLAPRVRIAARHRAALAVLQAKLDRVESSADDMTVAPSQLGWTMKHLPSSRPKVHAKDASGDVELVDRSQGSLVAAAPAAAPTAAPPSPRHAHAIDLGGSSFQELPYDPWGVPRDTKFGIPMIPLEALAQLAPYKPLYTRKLIAYTLLVKRLLPVGVSVFEANVEALRIFREDVLRVSGESTAAGDLSASGAASPSPLKQRHTRVQVAGALAADRRQQAPSLKPVKPRRFFDAVQDRLKQLMQPTTAVTGHALYEKPDDAFLPLRLVLACGLSIQAVWILCMLSAWVIRTSLFAVDIGYRRAVREKEALQVSALGRAVASGQVEANLRTFAALAELGSGGGSTESEWLLQAAELAGVAMSLLNSVVALDLELLRDWLKTTIAVGGYVGLAAALCGSLALWYFMLKTYRQRIFEMRQGVYSQLDKSKGGVSGATRYIPLQLWHTIFSFLACLFCVGIVIAALVTLFYSDAFLFNALGLPNLILTLAGGTLVTFVLRYVFLKCYVTRGRTIRHRRWFNYCDLLSLITDLVTGLLPILTRFLTTLGLSLLAFGRTDTPQLPRQLAFMDPSFTAYVGMQTVDHMHNNPIVMVLTELLWMDVQWKRHRQRQHDTPTPEQARRAAVLVRAKAKVWLAVTLHNNPQLISLRLARRQGRPESNLYNMLQGPLLTSAALG